jgi:histidyl-tRNA synthetase
MSPPLFQAPRGTSDVLPDEQRYRRLFESKAQELATRFGYDRIDTPVFEDARLFVRGIGEATDIIEKETYTFEDRGGELVTLRPEGTAPVCRAYLQHGMHNLPQPVRLFYFCPVFRYERPQAGRYREHHQFGVEALGDGDPAVDAEIIELPWRFLQEIGLQELSLILNSTGDSQCRPAYIDRLKAHYGPHVARLCPNCKRRLKLNPLRLLDCKEDSCQPVIDGAPPSVEYLCDACNDHWERLLEYLRAIGLPFEIDKRLVRGFDYYTRTVFEIVPPEEGRQSTIAGGGRYDGLIEELGGRPTPGIGFGMGIERVLLNLKRQEAAEPSDAREKVLVAYLGQGPMLAALALSSDLRRAGVAAVLSPSARSLRSQLRYASAIGASHAVIMGEDELRKGTAVVRDLARSEQREVSRDDLVRQFSAQ